MADELQVMLELGLKGKQVVAVAADWPGLERGAKTEETAIARLQAYLPRYASVAMQAGMDADFAAISARSAAVNVVERYLGTGSTDFWGISFAFSSIDRQAMSNEDLERELTLLEACWAFFDACACVGGDAKGSTWGRAGSRPHHPAYAERGARLGDKARATRS
jgi:hypothetical protein